MTILPASLLNDWKVRSRKRTKDKLDCLLEFRDQKDEYGDDWKAEGVTMVVYVEAAEAQGYSVDSFRQNLAVIREYAANDLCLWVDRGITFDHIETANSIAELARRKPIEIIEATYELGNETGKLMTVEQMTSWALGEREMPKGHILFSQLFERLGKFPNGLEWSDEKMEAWKCLTDEFKRRATPFFEKGKSWLKAEPQEVRG